MSAVKQDCLQVYQAVGERIRAERKKQKITQDELASQVGLTRTSITNVEKGKQKLLLHTLVQIADFLGTSPARLLPNREAKLNVEFPDETTRQVRNWIIHSIGTSNDTPKHK
jgi:transcriptional regulator with XRE-family HTH domain